MGKLRLAGSVTLFGAGACIYIMFGLPVRAWQRFGVWLLIGIAIYFLYGYRKSTLRRGSPAVAPQTGIEA